MEPPFIRRDRLVLDFSDDDDDDGTTPPPTPPPKKSSTYRHDWKSPQAPSRTVVSETKQQSSSTSNLQTGEPPLKQALSHKDVWNSPQIPDRSVVPDVIQYPSSSLNSQTRDLPLSPINESSSYQQSVSTQPTSLSGRSATRLADFFSPDVLHVVLHNPTTAHQLRKFAQSRLCGENLDFLEKVDQYHLALNQVTKTLFDIHRNFISVNSESQVNLDEDVLVQVNRNLKQLLSKTMPEMESIFVTAQSDIERLISSDIYPRFVRHQMTISATKALTTNVNKYAGLGDSFVLTNPNKADNPIVFASDGFVKVTGYKRSEIVPRNCRFLQTRQTDRESIKRIKMSLDDPAECVELLLNERRNGDPFWNLLYTAPLYHPNGKLAFYLGGQIDISTTIHNTSDILRILSCPSEDDDSEKKLPLSQPVEFQPTSTIKSYRNSLRNTLRRQRTTTTRQAGMESTLLDDLNRLSLNAQKDAFYSAYSRYLIVDTDNMCIAFHSVGITGLFPIAQESAPQSRKRFVGMDIFKFLNQQSNGALTKEYKSRVRGALKSGMAISIDVSLCTSRYGILEVFVSHWTPLKNEFNAMGFVVVTLSSQDVGHVTGR